MGPIPRNPRYETLDAWRGVACLSVIVFHALVGYIGTPAFETRVQTHGGSLVDWFVVIANRMWLGVPLFFVVSGYCIAASADSARRKSRPGASFFVRRFRRIYPPLWAFLAVCAAVVFVLPDVWLPGPTAGYPRPVPRPQDISWVQWLGSLTLTEEWRHYLGGPPRGYFAGQVWTLCYEEQFYFVIGLVVTLARRWLFPVVGVITALVFLNIVDYGAFLPGPLAERLSSFQRPLSGCFFDGLWLVFAAGVGVYYRLNYATPMMARCLDAFLLAGLVWALKFVPSAWEFGPTVPGYMVVGLAFALILGWLHRFDAVTSQTKWLAPLRFCGRMCYSLYLIHAPVAALISWNQYRLGLTTPLQGCLITVPTVIAVSVALSYVFHVLVERRFLNSPAPVRVGESRTGPESVDAANHRLLTQSARQDATPKLL